MIALIAALALSQVSPGSWSNPTSMGHLQFHGQLCADMGWIVNDEVAREMVESQVSPTMPAEFVNHFLRQGGEEAETQFRAEVAQMTNRATGRAWITTTEERCNAIVAAYPALLQRPSEPNHVFQGLKDGVERMQE